MAKFKMFEPPTGFKPKKASLKIKSGKLPKLKMKGVVPLSSLLTSK